MKITESDYNETEHLTQKEYGKRFNDAHFNYKSAVRKWLNSLPDDDGSDLLIADVYQQVQSLSRVGTCSVLPPIMGALIVLHVLDHPLYDRWLSAFDYFLN